MEDPGDRASLGFKTRFPGQMERDLAVQGGAPPGALLQAASGRRGDDEEGGFSGGSQACQHGSGQDRGSSQTQILPFVMLNGV